MTKEEKKALVDGYLAKLKAKGINVGEDMVADIVKETFDFGEAYILATESKTDDIALPFMPMAEKVLLGLVDKIDGEDDEGR